MASKILRVLFRGAFPALCALAPLPAQADPVEQGLMRPLTQNGLELSGAEYWPYAGSADLNYPDDVLWGFYPVRGLPADEPNPGTATPAAVACAEKAFAALQNFFAAPNPRLARVIALGRTSLITNKFYLWTNDYTLADTPFPPGRRESRLWYWKRNPQVPGYTPGFWKWESVLTQDGRCLTPGAAQIDAYLAAKLAELEQANH